MKISLLALTSVSSTFEIMDENNKPYYSKEYYDVYLDNELVYKDINNNVFTIYDLQPNKSYTMKITNNYFEENISFKTKEITNQYEINPTLEDMTNYIQDIILKAKNNSLIIFNPGTYYVKPIFLKSDLTLYFKKGCVLLANPDREQYPVLSANYGTWEGSQKLMFASLITGLNVSNTTIVGEGCLDGNAQNSDWWINHRVIRKATRPNTVYLNHCKNIQVIGLTIQNSPSWTVHPYYSQNVEFYNLHIINPKDSPNTDGCNPESCDEVRIIGCHISVGDDCIAIKSGKIEMVSKEFKPCENITIRNCLMENGHGAVVLGSEMSAGIKHLDVSLCLFINTDRGLRIKTRRGRGNKAIVDDVSFNNIEMYNVLNPFVINMFYFCDPDGKSEYVQSKDFIPIDERTPYLGKFHFNNIICNDALVSGAFFYGLPEQKIKLIEFNHVHITMKQSEIYEYPAMMSGIDKANQMGCYFENVEEIILNDFTIINQKGSDLIYKNIAKIKEIK